QAARELQQDGDPQWQQTETADPIAELFGNSTGDDGKRGALIFWDAFPVLPRTAESLAPDVMTPHQTHYYRDGEAPHDSGQPNPILFVTIPPGAQFEFFVDCKTSLLAPELAASNRWQTLLQDAFEYAFDWLGFGAKTAVGYGQMEIDREEQKERHEQAERARAEAEETARIKQATADLPPDAATIEAQIQRGGWSGNEDFIDWMEQWLDGLQASELSTQAWQRVEQQMIRQFDKSILVDPDAMKKRNKPKYKGRKKDLAKRLLQLKPNGDNT